MSIKTKRGIHDGCRKELDSLRRLAHKDAGTIATLSSDLDAARSALRRLYDAANSTHSGASDGHIRIACPECELCSAALNEAAQLLAGAADSAATVTLFAKSARASLAASPVAPRAEAGAKDPEPKP